MRKFFLAAVLVLMASGAQAATLNVIDGILHGASGVLVDGSLYDVQFLGGTCIDLYDGCDEASDFTFQTEASALLASQALLDQVFLDGPSGDFDSSPSLTAGCAHLSICTTLTPYGLSLYPDLPPPSPPVSVVLTYGAENHASTQPSPFPVDSTFFAELDRDWNRLVLSPADEFVMARWSVVPEPSTALLLGLGLVGLAGYRRR